jgi:hypothetical protein
MKNLTAAQRAVLWAGVMSLVGLSLWVPWCNPNGTAAPYGFIFVAPSTYRRVDVTRMLVPMGAVVLVTAALVFVGPKWRRPAWLGVKVNQEALWAASGAVVACLTIGIGVAYYPKTPDAKNEPPYRTPTGRVAPLPQWTDAELDEAIKQAQKNPPSIEQRTGSLAPVAVVFPRSRAAHPAGDRDAELQADRDS